MQSLLPQPDSVDQPTLDIAADLYRCQLRGVVNRAAIREINRSHGTDVATALLYLHFYDRLADETPVQPTHATKPWMIAIVPGAFYKEHPEIGGDGREIKEIAETNRWRCETIPTESLGTLESNAETIIRFLRERIGDYQILLTTLSKGTTDMITAAQRAPEIVEGLSGWISISGVPCGTMMADWLLDRWRLRPVFKLMCWRHGTDHQAVHDLRYTPQKLSETFPKIPCIHFAGFPLRRHLSNWRSRLWHRRFRSIGPNDSVVLLEDLLEVSGIVLPIWGADHYLKSDWNVALAIETIVARLSQPSPRLTQPSYK